jgi:diguanylate cyclase (GGDEF)-like protein/PAS domain S-box-containing protein
MQAPFGRSFLLPIAVLVALALSLSVGFIWYSARVQDRASFEASVEGTAEFLRGRMRSVGRVVKDYAWWNDAVRYLQLAPDADWADLNLGFYLYKTFGYELSAAVDPHGRTVYATVDGKRSAADAADLVRHGLEQLVEQAHRATGDDPEPVQGLVEIDGKVAIAAASAVTPEPNGEVEVPPEGRVVLVAAKRLDPAYLGDIDSVVPISDLRMVGPGEGRAGDATLPLLAADGTVLAALVWTPKRPGTATFVRVAPVLGAALLVLVVAAWRVLAYAKRAGDALQASEARFRDVADATSDWIWETDPAFRVTFLSPRFAETMGLPARGVLGRELQEFLRPLPEDAGWPPPKGEDGTALPFRNARCAHVDEASGRSRKLKLAGVPIFDRRGRHLGYRGTASDITTEAEAQSRAQFLALHDPLTELPNRVLLQERLQHAAARVAAEGGCAAVLCIDLDRFKEVNDKLGHAAGDRLLRAVAGRLLANVRKTDTVARVGGDEFVVVHLSLERPDDAQRLCHRLLRDLERPFGLGDQELLVTASLGVAFLREGGATPDQILRDADIALLRAKDTGRNTFSFYEQGMDARIQRRKAIERELRAGLKAQDFRLVYQPRFTLRGERGVSGVEALVRWKHPERGTLLPGDFIPVAEDTGLILALGDWILGEACARAAAWPGVAVAVNISPVQFKSRRLVDSVRRALERTGIEPRRLELEVTEGVLLENTDQSVATLRDLRALGVRLSMDDFGTGYASLSYLLRFDFDKIKIDRSFVQGLADRRHADAIVRSVLRLAHSLGMEVCAEGVETRTQLEFLRAEGCDEVQGFLLGRPLAPEEVAARLLGGVTSPALSPRPGNTSRRRARRPAARPYRGGSWCSTSTTSAAS